jgi:hypothetical protein
MTAESIGFARWGWLKEKGLGFEGHSVKLALANSGFHNLLIQTNEKPVELWYHATADGFFHIKAHNISSVNVASANLGVLNHDFRGGNPTPVMSAAVVASYTVSSTFYQEIIGVAGAGAQGGGGTHEEGFWILASSTDYVFEARNLSGGAANFSWDFDFFEIE